ncbi:MAG: uroporphyrinogen-III synthase [Bryobacterales bacterium]|nr:uroporphyrinogen-III synthase [Bryobacterales bacterium]
MSFEGLRVLSLESRRAKEMEALIRRWNGEPFVAPSVQERAIDSHAEALAWASRLIAGDFDLVLFTTGVGLAYLRDAVLTKYTTDQLADALRKTTIAVRGPKPLAILHELGVQPVVRIPEPNTWREMLPIVAGRPERRISIQEYGRSNPEFTAALEALGATVNTIAIYRWELPDDIGPLKEAARRLSRGDVDVLIFTTSVQYVHLMEIAANLGFADKLYEVLQSQVVIASVGPIMTAALREHGIEPDIEPDYPKMAALVRAAAEQSRAALLRKRATRA